MRLEVGSELVQFENAGFGFSAHRFFEHLAEGQANPYSISFTQVRSRFDAERVVDVVRVGLPWFALTGLTIADLDEPEQAGNSLGEDADYVSYLSGQPEVVALVESVVKFAIDASAKAALRNAPLPLLPPGSQADFLGAFAIRSKLREYFSGKVLAAKSPANQWIGTLQNLASKGVRSEELQRSGLLDFLEDAKEHRKQLTGSELLAAVDFSELRLSIVANSDTAKKQLRFEVVPERKLPKIKGEAKPQAGQQRRLHLFDRALGYRIEEVTHLALWGGDVHWQAVTFDGRVLRSRETRRAVFGSAAEAVARAQEHAKEHWPKMRMLGQWGKWAWTGGADYREWLITLPWYPDSYYSDHFALRNVLAHVRCDIREGGNGERILMLQEIQSDWAQQARRERQEVHGGFAGEAEIPTPPFLADWPSLVLKLMFLHAATAGVDAIAWTQGRHQVQRYEGRGQVGLRELYDQTLPREANRLLKPFGRRCEEVDVYVPANFGIRPIEEGYEVHTQDGRTIGISASMEEARELLPDGAHERLWAVHGVKLDTSLRSQIREYGFFAWGEHSRDQIP